MHLVRKKNISPNTVRNNAIIIVVRSIRNHSTVFHIQGRCQRNNIKKRIFLVKIRQETFLSLRNPVRHGNKLTSESNCFLLGDIKQYLFTRALMFVIVWHTLSVFVDAGPKKNFKYRVCVLR